MSILQDIFKDHYEEMIYTLHPRPSVIENVDKMVDCGNPAFGGAMYGCPQCGNLKFVPFRCHSRFCPTCGNLYAMQRTTFMSFKLINAIHRHCVKAIIRDSFTIDENLRHFFLDDHSLLDCLFHAVTSVVSRMFFKQNKSMNFIPGFIMVLHTFGRDLKWNPHIHCLISEGSYSDNGFWRNVHHFYNAPNEAAGLSELENIREIWGKKYPYTISNRKDVSSFFQFPDDIRRIMYTTNIIEGLNRQYRKVTKAKSVFPSDMALEKMRYRNWNQVLNQLVVLYEEWLTEYL